MHQSHCWSSVSGIFFVFLSFLSPYLSPFLFADEGKEIIRREKITSEVVKPGTEFEYVLYIPRQYDPEQPAALCISCDGLFLVHAQVQERLTDEGAAPVVVCLGFVAGNLHATREGGSDRFMRAEEYDQIGPDYANLLVEELIPRVIEKEHLNIDPSPDRHMIIGASSGGIAAWEIAWHRNDYFRRAYLNSPTFSSIRGGEEPMFQVRITETRPIRAYVTVGSPDQEPNFYGGNSYIAGCLADNTLRFAGYDIKFESFPDGPHGAGLGNPEVTERVMRFLWANWQTEPVKPLHNPDRVERLVTFGDTWKETTEPLPEPQPVKIPQGVYSFDGGNIYLTAPDGTKQLVSDQYKEITSLAISSDLWRLYVADRHSRFIDAISILPDGTLGAHYHLAPLRLLHRASYLGATDLCVDTGDRVYAATELGIQVIISPGITVAILPLPGDLPVEKLSFGGDGNHVLYTRSGDKVYSRTLKTTGRKADDPITAPANHSYFD